MESKKILFVFDFDKTLIDENVDTWIMSVHPKLQVRENLRSLCEEFPCWTDLMDHTGKLIYDQGVTSTQLLEHVGKARLFEQALKAVKAIRDTANADTIILSDANTLFIDLILTKSGVRGVFKEIISNPAHFDSDGRFRIQRYHSHTCTLCSANPNLCKGQVLTGYLNRDSVPKYSKVVYVGDGQNDFCPAQCLTATDVVVCRKGYGLEKRILDSGQPCEAETLIIDFIECLGDTITSLCQV